MSYPIPLDRIDVAAPCHADWDDMPGDDTARFCNQCRKHVYNLSGLTRTAAEQLIEAKEGRLCVRFFRRADGTVLTADCPVGQRLAQLRVFRWAGAAVGFLLGVVGYAVYREETKPLPMMGVVMPANVLPAPPPTPGPPAEQPEMSKS